MLKIDPEKATVSDNDILDVGVAGYNSENLILNFTKNNLHVFDNRGRELAILKPKHDDMLSHKSRPEYYGVPSVVRIFSRNVTRDTAKKDKNSQNKYAYVIKSSELMQDAVWLEELGIYICIEAHIGQIPSHNQYSKLQQDLLNGKYQFLPYFVVGNIDPLYTNSYVTTDGINITKTPIFETNISNKFQKGEFRLYINSMTKFNIDAFIEEGAYETFTADDCVDGVYTSKIDPNIKIAFNYKLLSNPNYTQTIPHQYKENSIEKVVDMEATGLAKQMTKDLSDKLTMVEEESKNKTIRINNMQKQIDRLEEDRKYVQKDRDHISLRTEDEVVNQKLENERLKEMVNLYKAQNEKHKSKTGILSTIVDVIKSVATICSIFNPFTWLFKKLAF